MRKNKLLLILLTALFFSCISKAQDSIQFQKRFFEIQQKSTLVLSGWSILNIGVSPLCAKNIFNPINSKDYFHQGNFNWNLVNIGIAGLSHYSVYTNRKKAWSIKDLNQRKKRLERTLIINIALDFCYIASGVLLKYSTDLNEQVDYPTFQGYGNSLILQGGFLLIFDYVFLRRIKSLKLI